MKLYLLFASTPTPEEDSGHKTHTEWVGSQTEAASTRKELVGEGFRRAEIATHEVDVPTNKPDLIAFLNALVEGPSAAAAFSKVTK